MMKAIFLSLLALAALANSQPLSAEEIRQAKLAALQQSLREIVQQGDGSMGIPVLDPFFEQTFHLALPGSLINFKVDVTDGSMNGLGNVILHDIYYQSRHMSVEYDIELPETIIRSVNYKMTGALYGVLPLYGDGSAFLNIRNLRMRGVAKLATSGNSVRISHIENAVFSISRVQSDTTGVIGGGDIDRVVNALIQDVAADYVSMFSAQIGELAIPLLVQYLNPYVQMYSLSELEAILP